jgi:hypothetical protein
MARPLNELSKKTLIDYTDKASNDMLKSDQSGKKSRGDKRFHGLIKAGDKLNAKTRAGIKEEKQMKTLKEILQLDEKKSWKDIIPGNKRERVKDAMSKHGRALIDRGIKGMNHPDKSTRKASRDLAYRGADWFRRPEKVKGKFLTGKGRKFSAEETQNDGEQLDELSKNTLDSYREKASADLSKRIKSSDKNDKHRAGRRMAGILTVRSKKNVSEETEQIDEISRKLAKSYLDKSLGKHSLSNHGTKEYEKTKKGRERAADRYVIGPKYYKRMKKKD